MFGMNRAGKDETAAADTCRHDEALADLMLFTALDRLCYPAAFDME
jgi:hypothetical protein